MKKETEIYLITGIIVILIILGIFYIKKNGETPEKKLAKCIGENSELYVQLGCYACKAQEEMFGENYQYLNVTDCTYKGKKCLNADIKKTPTWIIKGEKYEGVRGIEQLKELTGC